MSATDDDTEVTKTGIVRKRNENGYIIHPDREDTGTTDRHVAFAFIGGALLSLAIVGPQMLPYSIPFALYGVYHLRKARKKRRRVGGYRQ